MPKKAQTPESAPQAETTIENAPEQKATMWPEAKDKRYLRCDLKPEEINDLGKRNATLGAEIDGFKDAKTATMKQFAADIEGREAQRRSNEMSIRNGWVTRETECHWVYETSGKDSVTGEFNYHPEKKTLVRDDTGEPVEIAEITQEERQMALPMAEEQPPAEQTGEEPPCVA